MFSVQGFFSFILILLFSIHFLPKALMNDEKEQNYKNSQQIKNCSRNEESIVCPVIWVSNILSEIGLNQTQKARRSLHIHQDFH